MTPRQWADIASDGCFEDATEGCSEHTLCTRCAEKAIMFAVADETQKAARSAVNEERAAILQEIADLKKDPHWSEEQKEAIDLVGNMIAKRGLLS